MPKIRITGYIPKADLGLQLKKSFNFPPPDPDEEWIRKLMEYEFARGGYDATANKALPLTNWGYNAPKGYYVDKSDGKVRQLGTGTLYNKTGDFTDRPKTIDEAIARYKQEYLPDLKDLPAGMRERVGDFVYNTGKDYRVYMLDQYLKSKGLPGLTDRSGYNKNIYDNTAWTPELKTKFEAEWDKYKGDIDKLSVQEKVGLIDKGKDFYYQNIDQQNGKPNPAYYATWKDRIDMFGQYKAPDPKDQTVIQPQPQSNPVQSQPGPQPDDKTTQGTTTTGTQTSTTNTETTNTGTTGTANEGELPQLKLQESGYENKPLAVINKEPIKIKPRPTLTANPNLAWDEKDTKYIRQVPGAGKIKVKVEPESGRMFDDKTGDEKYYDLGPIWNKDGTPNKQRVAITNDGSIIDMRRAGKKGDYYGVGVGYMDKEGKAHKNPWLSQKIVDASARLANSRTFQKVGKFSGNVLKAATAAQPLIEYIGNRRREKDFSRFFRDTAHSMIPVNESFDRGVYDQWGKYKPNKLGFDSPGMYSNPIFDNQAPYGKYGGTLKQGDMKKIKIKILPSNQQFNMGGNFDREEEFNPQEHIKRLLQFQPVNPTAKLKESLLKTSALLPNQNYKNYRDYMMMQNQMANGNNYAMGYGREYGGEQIMATGGQPMTYSGQLGYGLNLGQKRIYTDMPPQKSETLSKKLQPVSRGKANLEAEEGETAYADVDGDGMMEHMEIGGKKHSQGGTPLNLPEGSFIFSDTAKMRIKDEKILKRFGMPPRKGGYTPAEIAKKYDINKLKAILEDKNSDEINKATAQLMIKTYQKKLAELALVQEQMKGFPQGVPDFVKTIIPELSALEGPQQKVVTQEENRRMPPQSSQPTDQPQQQQVRYGGSMYAGGGTHYLTRYDDGGPNDCIGGQVWNDQKQICECPANFTWDDTLKVCVSDDAVTIYNQTKTPATKASLKDPKYKKLQEILTKRAQLVNGKYKFKDLSEEEAREVSSLITYFGLQHDDEDGIKGHSIVQGGTGGYNWTEKNDKNQYVGVGFYGGVTPEMFENKVVNALFKPEETKTMSTLRKRRLFLKTLGIDDAVYTDEELKDSKKLYSDKDFFNKVFYPKFTEMFPDADYRKEMGNDRKIGLEHLDAFQIKIPDRPGAEPPQWVCVNGAVVKYDSKNSAHASLTKHKFYNDAQQECYEGPGKMNGKNIKFPFKFTTPDLVNLAAAMSVPPKARFPWRRQIPFQQQPLEFIDWQSLAHQRAANTAKLSEMLANYTPSPGLASRYAFLQGQQGEQIAADIARVNEQNVGIANQYGQQQARDRQANVAHNIGKAEQLYDLGVQTLENTDRDQRTFNTNIAKVYGKGWENRANWDLMNNVNSLYPMDPVTGRTYMNPYATLGADDLGGNWGSSNRDYTLQDFERLKTDAINAGMNATEAAKYASDQIEKSGGNRTSREFRRVNII